MGFIADHGSQIRRISRQDVGPFTPFIPRRQPIDGVPEHTAESPSQVLAPGPLMDPWTRILVCGSAGQAGPLALAPQVGVLPGCQPLTMAEAAAWPALRVRGTRTAQCVF